MKSVFKNWLKFNKKLKMSLNINKKKTPKNPKNRKNPKNLLKTG